MGSYIADFWDRARVAPDDAWHWFNSLNREEWLVVLIVTCSFGFVAMLGFRSHRL